MMKKQKKNIKEKIIEELCQIRELKPEEKGKSLDYWEGYTQAVSKIISYLKDLWVRNKKKLK